MPIRTTTPTPPIRELNQSPSQGGCGQIAAEQELQNAGNTQTTAAQSSGSVQGAAAVSGQGFATTDQLTDNGVRHMVPDLPVAIWQRAAFDDLVSSLLGGNTSIRDAQATQLANLLSALPDDAEAVHAARALSKLKANNYIKSDEHKALIGNALYGALTRLDNDWSGRSEFGSVVSDLFSKDTTAQDASPRLIALLGTVDDRADLVHVVRALFKLASNDLLGDNDTRSEILSAMYSKLAELAPKGATGWAGQKQFKAIISDVLRSDGRMTDHQAHDLAKLVGSIDNVDAMVLAARNLEKVRVNDGFGSHTFKIVGDAAYARLSNLDQPKWPAKGRFDEMVGKLFAGNTSARIPEAEEMAGLLTSIDDAGSAVHVLRAIEKLQANTYFKGAAKETIDNGVYEMLIRMDKPLPTLMPHQRG